MAGYKKTDVVHTPVEKVFDYLNDPNKLIEYWPGMVEVSDVRPPRRARRRRDPG